MKEIETEEIEERERQSRKELEEDDKEERHDDDKRTEKKKRIGEFFKEKWAGLKDLFRKEGEIENKGKQKVVENDEKAWIDWIENEEKEEAGIRKEEEEKRWTLLKMDMDRSMRRMVRIAEEGRSL